MNQAVSPEGLESLEAAAHAQAALGQHAQAFALMQQANAARDRAQTDAARHHAVELQRRLDADRIRAEAQVQRERAAAEAERTRHLQAANLVLEGIGSIGRAITARLDLEGIFREIYEHLHHSLRVEHLSIWLLDEPSARLHMRFGLEVGHALSPVSVPLDHPESMVAHCARLGREVLCEQASEPPQRLLMPGTLPTRTALFGPMRARHRALGVLSIQTLHEQACGERERRVFSSVCAWAAVALDNAAVILELESALRDLRAARDAEQRAREAAEQANQLKLEVMANTSHDLRTPLASLHGYLETLMLRGEQLGIADRQRYLGTALSQSDKVRRLASELLELSQWESGAVTLNAHPFSLVNLAQEVLHKLELAAQRRSQSMELCAERGLPPAWGDVDLIERVFTNLLDNAIQHAPPGSQVRVEIGLDGDGLGVQVLDTGPGIPLEQRDGLFQRPSAMVQSHRPGGGGLGLLIVQRLLQLHHSDIELVDRPGFGGGFRFCVPRGAGVGA